MTKSKSKPKAATRSPARKTAEATSRKRSAPASPSRQSGPAPSTPISLPCCVPRQAQQSLRSWPQPNGSSIQYAVFLPVSSARNSGSTLFQSRLIRVGCTASGMARLRPPVRIALNRQPDAMQKKRRNGRVSTKTSVEDEIAHLRGLDLRGLGARWQGVFQRSAPAHLTRHLLFAIIAYRIQADRFVDLDHKTKQLLHGTLAKETGP